MGFRLVTIGRPSDNSEPSTPTQVAPRRVDPRAEFLVRQVIEVAGDVPDLWKKVHTTFVHDYRPVWHRIDEQDILVGWAAAGRALAKAEQELARINGRIHYLTSRQRATRDARLADIRFWRRLLPKWESRAIAALSTSRRWAGTLEAVLSKFHASSSQGPSHTKT